MKKLLFIMLSVMLIASCTKDESSELLETPKKVNQAAVIEVFQAENNQILINWNTYLVGNVQVKDTATFKHVDFSILEIDNIKEISVLKIDKYNKVDTLEIFSITSDTLSYINKEYTKLAVNVNNLTVSKAPYNIRFSVKDIENSTTSINISINYKF